MPTVIIHLQNEDAVIGEVEELPTGNITFVRVANPRRRDGKELSYLDPSVSTVLFSLNRITFIEVLPEQHDEEIISPVRE